MKVRPFSPTRSWQYSTGPPDSSQIAIADLNEDGNLDLAIAHRSAITLLLGDGTGGLAAAPTIPERLWSVCLGAADFDLDGKLDLTDGSDVYRGRGDGSFLPGYPLDGPGCVAPVDLNGDGLVDVVSDTGVVLLNRSH